MKKNFFKKIRLFFDYFYRAVLAWLHIRLVAMADAVARHGKRMVERQRSQAVSLMAV